MRELSEIYAIGCPVGKSGNFREFEGSGKKWSGKNEKKMVWIMI